MSSQRASRWDNDVDPLRTIAWFRTLGACIGTHHPRDIQRVIAPGTVGLDSNGDVIRNNKFLDYSRGKHVPHREVVRKAELQIPQSSWVLDHPTWLALRKKGSIKNLACDWVRQLNPEIQRIVLSPSGNIALGAGRHTLGSLERRANMDSLAALTILLRLCSEEGEHEWAWLYAHSVFRVLLLIWPYFDELTVADQVFRVFVQRIFSQVSFAGQRMALENYDYSAMSWLLRSLAEDVPKEDEPQRTRKMPSFYALQILDGKRDLKFRRCFQIPMIQDEAVKPK